MKDGLGIPAGCLLFAVLPSTARAVVRGPFLRRKSTPPMANESLNRGNRTFWFCFHFNSSM